MVTGSAWSRSSKGAYYAKRGWHVLQRFEAWDKEQWLMARDL